LSKRKKNGKLTSNFLIKIRIDGLIKAVIFVIYYIIFLALKK